MDPNSVTIYYIVSFFALLIGIYFGIVIGANVISKSDNIGDKCKNALSRQYEKLSKKKEKPVKQRKEKEPKLPLLLRLRMFIKLPQRKPKQHKTSLLDSRIASRASFTETQAYMDDTDVGSIVKKNQKNNVRQYDIMSRRKADREQNEVVNEAVPVQEKI
jgi:hypothetical protein